MICAPAQLHLVHGMLLAKQSAAFSTVDAAVYRAKAFAAGRVRTRVVARWPLPVVSTYELLRVDGAVEVGLAGRRGLNRNGIRLVGFKHFQPS